MNLCMYWYNEMLVHTQASNSEGADILRSERSRERAEHKRTAFMPANNYNLPLTLFIYIVQISTSSFQMHITTNIPYLIIMN